MKALTKKRSQNWLLTFFLRIKLATGSGGAIGCMVCYIFLNVYPGVCFTKRCVLQKKSYLHTEID
jgi:hypothetical protein